MREIVDEYRAFARDQAVGRSPAYEELAQAVASDEDILSFLADLPAPKRQPNLLFACARFLLGAPATHASLRRLVSRSAHDLRREMMARRTQTNEPRRCAMFLPALAQLPQPLALIEVGASAGLLLLPDLYSYDYSGQLVHGNDPDAPVLSCEARGRVPVPDHVPQVVWRVGIDLNPLDVNNADDVAWLECLVWPGEGDRAAVLEAAIATAQRHLPSIRAGDLVDLVTRLAAEAPASASLVVFHAAVMPYLTAGQRQAFVRAVRVIEATWLYLEGFDVAGELPPSRQSSFMLVRDGRVVLADCDPHGTLISWRD